MNPDVALEIVGLAVTLAKTQTSGKVQQDAELAGILLQIIEKAGQAYQDHTRETLKPVPDPIRRRASIVVNEIPASASRDY